MTKPRTKTKSSRVSEAEEGRRQRHEAKQEKSIELCRSEKTTKDKTNNEKKNREKNTENGM